LQTKFHYFPTRYTYEILQPRRTTGLFFGLLSATSDRQARTSLPRQRGPSRPHPTRSGGPYRHPPVILSPANSGSMLASRAINSVPLGMGGAQLKIVSGLRSLGLFYLLPTRSVTPIFISA